MSRGFRSRAELLDELKTLDALRQRAEETAQERDRLNRLLVENSLGLMCSHDLDGVLLSINPAAAHSLGYRPEDGIGHNLREFLAPAVQPFFDTYLAHIRQQPTDSGFLRLVARDGTERTWMYRNVRYDEPGAPSCVLGHALDVTERLQMEQALAESEARFRLMVNTVPVLIWMAAPDGARTFFNAPWLEFSGRSLEQELGRGWMENIDPEDRARCEEAYGAGIHAHVDFQVEYRLRRVDGAYRWMRDLGVPRFTPTGAFAGFIGSCTDITADRQALEEREARAQAETALRLRDDVLSLATHDLRNPLASILGRADLATQQLQRGSVLDPAWLVKQLQAIRVAAQHMVAVTEELADVTLLQMDQQLDLTLEDVDLSDLAQTVAEECGVALRTAQIEVSLPEQALAVRGDRERLARVLRNLLENGVKFSPVDVPVHLTLDQDAQWVVIVVRDQGVGISAEDLPRVFERFFRAETATGVKGSGLGLAGARAIIERHAGTIAIESAVGQGTTVTLRLPRQHRANRM